MKIMDNAKVVEPRRSGKYTECGEDVYAVLHKVLQYEEMQSFVSIKFKLLFAEPQKSKGRIILGKISVTSERDALLHPYQSTICINEVYWRHYPDKREALLYHELCHLAWNDKTDNLETVGHDIEEFYMVIRRFGDWQNDLNKLQNANLAKQLELQYEDQNLEH